MNASHDKGLEFRGNLPLSLTAIEVSPDDMDLILVNQGNEQVLRSVLMLEDKPDADDDDPIYAELKRQDLKINLILDLLSTIMVQFNAMPAARQVLLTASDLTLGEHTASVSGHCEIKLYIEPTIPRPLQLYGFAVHDPVEQSTRIAFQGISRPLSDQLEKFIFRYHRRLVASQKAGDHAG